MEGVEVDERDLQRQFTHTHTYDYIVGSNFSPFVSSKVILGKSLGLLTNLF